MKDGEKFWKGTNKSFKDRNYKGGYAESLNEINARASEFLGNLIE